MKTPYNIPVILLTLFLVNSTTVSAKDHPHSRKKTIQIASISQNHSDAIKEIEDHFGFVDGLSIHTFLPDRNDINTSELIHLLNKVAHRNQSQSGYQLAYIDPLYTDLSPSKIHLLRTAIQKVVQTGTTVLVPAGDDSLPLKTKRSIVAPAGFPETVTISGYTHKGSEDQMAILNPDSNFGKQIDLVQNTPSSKQATQQATQKTLERTIPFYIGSRKSGNSTPSPRLVHWELVSRQSAEIDVIQPNGDTQVMHNVNTIQYQGDEERRVPDHYTPFQDTNDSQGPPPVVEIQDPVEVKWEFPSRGGNSQIQTWLRISVLEENNGIIQIRLILKDGFPGQEVIRKTRNVRHKPKNVYIHFSEGDVRKPASGKQARLQILSQKGNVLAESKNIQLSFGASME